MDVGTKAAINILQSSPVKVRQALLDLHNRILDLAEDTNHTPLQISVKWGQVSYASAAGTPLRLGWSAQDSSQYYLFVHCQTRLIPTIKEVYGERFVYQGNRAIVLDIRHKVPSELDHVIALAFNYKQIKNLPLLGL